MGINATFGISRLTALVFGFFAIAGPLSAQLIGLRTVPLAAGDQFLIFPSSNLGMGGASIALDDLYGDPFSNPAMGSLLEESRVFSTPTFYSVTNDNGGARTMPFGIAVSGDEWFGGGMVALQDLDQGRSLRNWIPPLDDAWTGPIPSPSALAVRSATNRFAQLSLGRRLNDRWSIGASAFFADLKATDGVEQLFANAWEIDESGSVKDFRVGVVGHLEGGGRIEAAVVRNRLNMQHDVTTVTFELTDSMMWRWMPTVDEESHQNISKTWGGHLAYTQPIEGTSWRAGGIFTVNRKDHPKIPTYDLTAVDLPERPPIPRDPGNSWAFNIGGGLAYEEGPTTFAIDIVYQPAVSDTWADELVDVMGADSVIIPAGGHTVDNHFVFSNAHASVGLEQRFGRKWAGQLGVSMQSYSYDMDQEDHVTGIDRSLTQQWTQWTPTWGASYELNGLEIRYVGLASSASHFPFPDFAFSEDDVVWAVSAPELAGDILAPPSGRLGTPDETVVTHRIQISVPIR